MGVSACCDCSYVCTRHMIWDDARAASSCVYRGRERSRHIDCAQLGAVVMCSCCTESDR